MIKRQVISKANGKDEVVWLVLDYHGEEQGRFMSEQWAILWEPMLMSNNHPNMSPNSLTVQNLNTGGL